MDKTVADDPMPQELGLWDAVSLIVGIVVGVGIFETPPLILSNLDSPWTVLGVWALAGLLCFLGALCYAELTTSYPKEGGDYTYLTRAYGRCVGFLYGWATMGVILTANIGMMTYVFADYAHQLFGVGKDASWMWAGDAVLLLTFLNLLGVKAGKWTQNILTVIKVVGLAGIIVAGLAWPSASAGAMTPTSPPKVDLAAALVLVFITYGGWNDAAYVAAEVRDGRRNIPRALLLGVSAIMLIYVLVNFAYLRGLGYDGAMKSEAVAADVLKGALGDYGHRVMSVLVMISALGAANGIIFTGSRVSMSLGRDHALFASLGRCHEATGTPYLALIFQAGLTLLLIRLVGTELGRWLLNSLFTSLYLPPVSISEGQSGFTLLLRCTAPIFWLFFLMASLSLFVLRWRDPQRSRPFPVPGYPLVPLIFSATCAYMLYSGIMYAGALGLVGAGILGLGLPLYFVSQMLIPLRPDLSPSSPWREKP